MAENATKTAKASGLPVSEGARGSVEPRARRGPIGSWERELDDLLEDLRSRLRWPALFGAARDALDLGHAGGRLAHPAMELFEQGDEVIVKAEVPGMAKEDIEVTLSDSTLTVKGEKRREEERKEGDHTWSERSFGTIRRAIDLPVEVKPESARATLENGVLEVRFAKSDEAKHRATRIQIQ